MDPQLKQRLVGVAVIFLLAIIFVPMLLDGAGTRPQPLQVEIPPQPQVDPFEVIEPRIIELKKQAENLPRLEPRIVDEVSDPAESGSAESTVKNSEPKSTASEELTRTAAPSASVADASKGTPANVKPTQSTPTKSTPAKSIKPVATADPGSTEKKPTSNISTKSSATTARSGGETWIIQAGSFLDKQKAYKLRDRIRRSKLASDVFIEKFPHSGKILYRVRLGMFFSRAQAKVVANKLRAKFNIRGLVQLYDQ